MRDPYEVLGVAKNASAKDIKSAYRKLAKKHHPDQNPNDPKAKDRFAAANQAYEIVGDEKTRARVLRAPPVAVIPLPDSAASSRGRAARDSNSAQDVLAATRSMATAISSARFSVTPSPARAAPAWAIAASRPRPPI